MTELKELAKLNGYTMKQLATMIDVPYTTLTSMAKTSIEHWNENIVKKIAEAFHLTKIDFENAILGQALTPFIKWVGGKRQLLPQLLKYMPKDGFNTYYEPFIGGGALLLRLAPQKAVINDFNPELANAWEVVKKDYKGLSEQLMVHQDNDSKEYYLNIRSADRDGRINEMTKTQRGARFIYMNKAGYNGLWRVNSKGQNNVPYGGHSKLNLIPDSLKNVSDYLNRADVTIMNGDYRTASLDAETGDFVYFDPPYVPVTQSASFTSYTIDGFGLIQQEQLRDTALELARKGVKVMLSNADVPLVKDLYADPNFHVHHVQANRFVNSKAGGRGKVGEVIITTY